MENKLVIKKCNKCGTMVKMINSDNCENTIQCCGNIMEELLPNSVDAAVEKHIPNYEKVEDEIFVTVNHVMEKEHYIEWLALVTQNKEYFVTLYPEQEAQTRFPYTEGATLYAYCNKHGLWKKEIEE